MLVVFPDMYGRLVGKRIDGPLLRRRGARAGIHACDYLLACDMDMDPVPGYEFTSWAKGYGDFRCRARLATLRLASWLAEDGAGALRRVTEEGHELVEVAPRRMLARQIARAAEMGYVAMAGAELELYVFKDRTRRRGEELRQPRADRPLDRGLPHLPGHEGGVLIGAIRRASRAHRRAGRVVEGRVGTGAAGDRPRYAELLEMADRHAIYKHAAKEIACHRARP